MLYNSQGEGSMRRIIAIGAVLVLGAAIASCSGGSSGSGGPLPTTATGPISSAMSAPNRDGAGYSYTSEVLAPILSGRVTAASVAPNSSFLNFVAHEPLHQAALRGNGPALLDNTFATQVSSLAPLGSDLFAATTSVGFTSSGSSGMGDIFRRVQTGPSSATWQVAFDSTDPEATVGLVGSNLFAATGGPASNGTVLAWSPGSQSFSTVATLPSGTSPTAIAGVGNTLYVGAASPSGAQLYSVTGGVATATPLPPSGPPVTGGRAQVSALLTVGLIPPGAGGSGTQAVFYSDIVPVLVANCTMCHADSQNVTAFAIYRLSPQASSLADYRKTINEVNLTNVDASDLLTQAQGLNHPFILNVTDPQYIALRSWIVQGAVFNNPGGPGPGVINPPADPTFGQAMVVAVAQLDAQGQGVSGSICATQDGNLFEVLTSFSGEAPTALAFIDNTVYAATTAGRLYYRQADGTWALEAGIPQNRGLYALATLGPGRLLIGAQSDQGPLAIDRLGLSTPVGPPPTPTFAANVRPVLTARCVGCHGNPAIVGAAYPLTGDDPTDKATTQARVLVNDPDNSPLLLKATGTVTHGGGPTIPVNGPDYNSIRAWIAAGAP